MSLSLGIFIVILLFFSLRGYFKGFFGALSSIVSLVIAYISAFLFVKPVALLLREQLGLEGMLIYLIAGLIIFAIVSTVVSLFFLALEKLVHANAALTLPSKIGGLCVGILVGSLVGAVAIYGVSIAREIGQDEKVVSAKPVDHTARKLMGKIVSTATSYAYPEAAAFSEAFVTAPVSMSKSVQSVANNPDIKILFSDNYYQQLLTHGDTQGLMREPVFQRLASNSDVQYFLQQSQLAPENTGGEEVLATALIDSWQGFHAVRNDARVQAIMSDPQFQRKLQSGDKFALMNDAQLQELAEIFFQVAANARSAK